MIKVYAIIGEKNNVVLDIPYGAMKVRVNFQGGNIFRGIPAKMYTKDPFIERVLDNSDLNGKLYRLIKTIPEASDNPAKKEAKGDTKKTKENKKNTTAQNDLKFDNAAEAIEYIATTYNEQVENESEAIAFLTEKGITCTIG